MKPTHQHTRVSSEKVERKFLSTSSEAAKSKFQMQFRLLKARMVEKPSSLDREEQVNSKALAL